MKKIIVVVIVLLIIVGVVFLTQRKARNNSDAQIKTIEVVEGDLTVKVLATGTIKPYTRVEIRPSVKGRINEIYVEEGDKVKAGEILAKMSSEDRVVLLDAANSLMEEAKKKNDKEAISRAESQIKIAEDAYESILITASISGTIIKRAIEKGQNVLLDTVMFVISDRLVASVEVDESDIAQVKIGQSAIIVLDAYPEKREKGRVAKISHESRTVSNVTVYDILVEPDYVPNHWASGMTANVEFLISEKKNVLLIPQSVIQKNKVMVLNGNEKEIRKIKTGASDGRMIEVKEGLEIGEKVVTEGVSMKEERKDNNLMRGMRNMGRMRR